MEFPWKTNEIVLNQNDHFYFYFQKPSLKYANFPSCSESDWGPRYWNDYARLQNVKKYWDPANTFNHCHSVGSSNNTCCPDYDSNNYNNNNNNNNNNKQTCTATNGRRCVFPFSYMMRE